MSRAATVSGVITMSQSNNDGEISHSVKLLDRFEWTIHDFLNRNLDTRIESPGFRFAEATWHLVVGYQGKEQNGHITLTLWRKQRSGVKNRVRVGAKTKDGKDGMVTHGETDTDGFLEMRKFAPWPEIAKNKSKLFFPKGHLTVFCEMCAEANEATNAAEARTRQLIQNLKDLFLDGQNNDVVLKVEGKEFNAHKAILAARCPVFASMFQHDMTENNSGVVDIPDCSSDAFKAFLLYLYTGEVDECTSDTVIKLYYIADKYCIQDLKKHCIKFMKDDMSVDTFCGVITLSLCHNESELIEAASSFFTENVKIIIKTAEWQTYLKQNPIHANELYIKAIEA